ncbi:uncharacterized protein [Diadema antillarum]|uniref:uncharacterized protein n=1 Tax=Diadema antillarum TaxID=105358 RepID=UPI003A85915F
MSHVPIETTYPRRIGETTAYAGQATTVGYDSNSYRRYSVGPSPSTPPPIETVTRLPSVQPTSPLFNARYQYPQSGVVTSSNPGPYVRQYPGEITTMGSDIRETVLPAPIRQPGGYGGIHAGPPRAIHETVQIPQSPSQYTRHTDLRETVVTAPGPQPRLYGPSTDQRIVQETVRSLPIVPQSPPYHQYEFGPRSRFDPPTNIRLQSVSEEPYHLQSYERRYSEDSNRTMPGETFFRRLDEIHEDGHTNIDRFTTDELRNFHNYLTQSSETGRNLSRVPEEDEDSQKMTQEQLRTVMKKLREMEDPTTKDALSDLLLMCEMSFQREPKTMETDSAEGFAGLFTYIWTTLTTGIYINDQLEHPAAYIGINLLLDAAQRFTESSTELSQAMGQNAVPLLLYFLGDPFFSTERLDRDDEALKWMSRRELLKKIFTILYNCIRNYPDNKNVFRENRAMKRLRPFLTSRFFILRAKALFILAYVVTEEENAELNTSPENISFIIRILRKALNEPNHYSAHYNYYATEVVEAIEYVASNDKNKVTFVERDVLPLLVSMIAEGNDIEERRGALKAIWVFSFIPSLIKDDEDLIKSVAEMCMKTEEDGEVVKTAKGVLWNVGRRDLLKKQEKGEEEEEESETEEGLSKKSRNMAKKTVSAAAPVPMMRIASVAPSKPQHVMLSYQWDVQEQILKVKDLLKAKGYNVWMDVEQMGGSTLEAMALAVEDAAVIVICFSEKYKNSPACRTEAEYTYNLRKPIVPLKMQKDYKADGWLGAMLGSKLYIEMHAVEMVERNIDKLVRELANRGCRSSGDRGKAGSGRSCGGEDSGKTGSTCAALVKEWDMQGVKMWLERKNYSHVQNWFLGYCGKDLLSLKRMANDAPDFFYRKMESDFGFRSLIEILRFRDMLDEIN